MQNNRFKPYTDQLAEILLEKNQAYGDSFKKSLDKDGLLVAKIRIGDKVNRLNNLIKHPETNVNDEPLTDTLEDLAGYALLTMIYCKEHQQ